MKYGFKRSVTQADQIEKTKYQVTRNLFMVLALILGVLGVLNLIQNDINMYPLFGGAVLCLITLGILIQSKNVRFAAFIAAIMGLIMTVYNISISSNFIHFVDFFWIICMAVYIFFILGNTWGIINLFLNIAVVVLMLHLIHSGIIDQVEKEYSSFSEINFIINIIVSGAVFAYVIIKVLDALRKAKRRYRILNEELTNSNEEKTIMLKEIHHRVKNNLQVITSLLRLQLNELDDEKSRHHFNDSINRVSAMALIHEKMYQTKTLSEINLESYLNDLIESLVNSYSTDKTIEPRITSNIRFIEPKTVVPLALIFNELISNSIEHAFNDRDKGLINIDVQKTEKGSTTIHYSDNGIWKDPKKRNTFGVEVIDAFTDQLEGTCRRSADKSGTHYYFEFEDLLL